MREYRTAACLLAVVWWASFSLTVRAAEPPVFNGLPIPTMGGKQFWADEFFFHQWRIQRNVLTDHCRLLDEHNLRHASGTFRHCRAKLEWIRRDRRLPPMKGKAVIVVHGLFRTRSSMERLCSYLRERGGYTVFNVGYPSTQRDVGSHAQTLGRVLANLDGIEEISFVAHSMGNIVIRHYLADRNGGNSPAPPAVRSTAQTRFTNVRAPRMGRFVMLAPPNHGSLAAVTFAENGVFKALAGKSGQELGGEWAKLQGKLATPEFEFGILAGGRNNDIGYNPLLPGDDDGTVSVASTRLAGASDFLVLPVLHSSIIYDTKVMECTLRFLEQGHFVSAAARHPVRGGG